LVVGGTGILQDGRDARESSKYRKAISLGIKILMEEDFS
jgi:hypothetical protein